MREEARRLEAVRRLLRVIQARDEMNRRGVESWEQI